MRARRGFAAIVLTALVAGAGLAGTAGPASASPPKEATPQEQISAIVLPSVVYISTTWSGYVEYPYEDGTTDWFGPYEAQFSCSGFIASPDGYIGTANHCVSPDRVNEQAIIGGFFEDMATNQDITFTDAEQAEALDTWAVEGLKPGAPVALLKTQVSPTVAASGIKVGKPFEAQVVKSTPVAEGDEKGLAGGDVALLKVDNQGIDMPALAMASEDPTTGTAITSFGFPASVGDVVDPTLEPSAKTGTVSGHQNVEGAPFTEISSAMSGGMSGGPTVDDQGRVIGVNSFGPTGEPEAFNFVTGTSSMKALLSQYDVSHKLSGTDRAYRSGLDAYFAEDYDKAIEQFDKVLSVQPSHAQAQKYKADAVKAAAAAPKSSSSPLPFILIGLVVLVAGAIVFVVIKLRRKPQPPTPITVPVRPVIQIGQPVEQTQPFWTSRDGA